MAMSDLTSLYDESPRAFGAPAWKGPAETRRYGSTPSSCGAEPQPLFSSVPLLLSHPQQWYSWSQDRLVHQHKLGSLFRRHCGTKVILQSVHTTQLLLSLPPPTLTNNRSEVQCTNSSVPWRHSLSAAIDLTPIQLFSFFSCLLDPKALEIGPCPPPPPDSVPYHDDCHDNQLDKAYLVQLCLGKGHR